ncbi:unnamed protein product, partial [marine sediment metagenome]
MIDRWKLYDLIYDKADKLLKRYNPCNIRIENGGLVCNLESDSKTLCCSHCQYLGENGCTTKCLGCKIGMCWQGDSMQKTVFDILQKNLFNLCNIPHKFINQMDRLQKIAYKYDLNRIRTSKETLFAMQE